MRSTTILAVLACACGVAAAVPASAQTVPYHATISPAAEVPPVTNSKATGRLSAVYDPGTMMLTYDVNYADLTGTAAAAHFHGPAPTGKNAGVMVPIGGSLANPIKGTVKLTPEQAKALADGDLYFNIHTPDNKNGEMRGQVEKGM